MSDPLTASDFWAPRVGRPRLGGVRCAAVKSAGTRSRFPTSDAPCCLSRDSVLPSLNEVIVVPATRTIRGIDTEVVLTEDDGMPAACALNFDHVSLARKERLGATLTSLGESRWGEVEGELLVACGFARGA